MNKFSFSRRALTLALSACALGAASLAHAQGDYPSRPITLVVGYPAGGSTDLTARLFGDALSKRIGERVIVENVGGAGGAIGAQRVAKARADGYTLLLGASNEMAIASLINKAVKYDGLKDFTPVGMISSQPMVLVASANSPVKNIPDFLAQARANPGKFSFGTSGVGTALHLSAESLKEAAGVQLVHIPYRGVAPLASDIMGGQLQFGVFVLSSALPNIRAGKLVPLGLMQAERAPLAPEIPTFAEAGLKDVNMDIWFGLYGPAGLPEPVVKKLRTALGEVLQMPEFRAKMQESGSTVAEAGVDLAKFQRKETEKYKRIVEFAKIEE
ncbi:ABC transporter substrate-binding protein [Pigmentiphaga sp. NML080357]|uniref:Bug family tripartite tricarboxylate transporter substrate binding protein n=1 Tax=Pigmentiphaga sp. NML080357 TaxID=2008675 RepID=UPI000B41E2FB|nr:tripartite tricarboxylate transporter substrate binding protein [Pigmentiphaga sp. NML080357]OVZ60220.1 ABC transporter substrate-binding protein [Pigmentiphaga sp. NML080357]